MSSMVESEDGSGELSHLAQAVARYLARLECLFDRVNIDTILPPPKSATGVKKEL